jgi:hypothetical protein
MSLWELTALVDGFNSAHGGDGEGSGVEPMTLERLKQINPPMTLH